MRAYGTVCALVVPGVVLQLATTPLDPWTFLRDVGFPIAVACFVLFRVEPALKDLTAALHELRVSLAYDRAKRAREGNDAE